MPPIYKPSLIPGLILQSSREKLVNAILILMAMPLPNPVPNVLGIPLLNEEQQLLNALLWVISEGAIPGPGDFIKPDGTRDYDDAAQQKWPFGNLDLTVDGEKIIITDSGTGEGITLTKAGITKVGGTTLEVKSDDAQVFVSGNQGANLSSDNGNTSVGSSNGNVNIGAALDIQNTAAAGQIQNTAFGAIKNTAGGVFQNTASNIQNTTTAGDLENTANAGNIINAANAGNIQNAATGDYTLAIGGNLVIDGDNGAVEDVVIPGVGTLRFKKGIYIGMTP